MADEDASVIVWMDHAIVLAHEKFFKFSMCIKSWSC